MANSKLCAQDLNQACMCVPFVYVCKRLCVYHCGGELPSNPLHLPNRDETIHRFHSNVNESPFLWRACACVCKLNIIQSAIVDSGVVYTFIIFGVFAFHTPIRSRA